MNYYFINFLYGASEKELYNEVIDKHPLEWQREANKSYPGQYVLKDWKEVTKGEYEKYSVLSEKELIMCGKCRVKTIPKKAGIHYCSECGMGHEIEKDGEQIRIHPYPKG